MSYLLLLHSSNGCANDSQVLLYTYIVCLVIYALWQEFLCRYRLRNPPVSQKIVTIFTRTLQFPYFWIGRTRSQSITYPSDVPFPYFTAIYSTAFHLQYPYPVRCFIEILYTGLFIIPTVHTSCIAHLVLRQTRHWYRERILRRKNWNKKHIWYDMIWYDMIWYDMIWYDMIWYDMIWYDMIW